MLLLYHIEVLRSSRLPPGLSVKVYYTAEYTVLHVNTIFFNIIYTIHQRPSYSTQERLYRLYWQSIDACELTALLAYSYMANAYIHAFRLGFTMCTCMQTKPFSWRALTS
jgi:hypothetical protein